MGPPHRLPCAARPHPSDLCRGLPHCVWAEQTPRPRRLCQPHLSQDLVQNMVATASTLISQVRRRIDQALPATGLCPPPLRRHARALLDRFPLATLSAAQTPVHTARTRQGAARMWRSRQAAPQCPRIMAVSSYQARLRRHRRWRPWGMPRRMAAPFPVLHRARPRTCRRGISARKTRPRRTRLATHQTTARPGSQPSRCKAGAR